MTWTSWSRWNCWSSRPTVNIEGLVGGYTGPGGKTILPHRAVAKLDLRLVPDMTAAEALAALKAHLAKRGFPDIEVNMTGGYDPTSTPADSAVVRAAVAVYKRAGHRSDLVAAPGRLLAWICFHRRSACGCRPATSAWATATEPTRPTNITSSNRGIRRLRAWTAPRAPTWTICTNWR